MRAGQQVVKMKTCVRHSLTSQISRPQERLMVSDARCCASAVRGINVRGWEDVAMRLGIYGSDLQ